MNEDQLELRLGRWLAAGPAVAPEHLAAEASAFAVAHPRRDGLGRRGLFAVAGALVRPMPFALRPIVLLALLALTFTLGAFFYGAWHNNAVVPQPSPTIQPSPSLQPSPGPAGYACPPGSSPDQPGDAGQARPARWVRAGIGVDSESNVVVYATNGIIWAFDLCTNTWHNLLWVGLSQNTTDGTAVAYDVDSDRIVVVQGGFLQSLVYVLDANSNEVGEGLPRRNDPVLDPSAVYDPSTGLVIVRDGATSKLWTYRLETDEWRELEQRGDVPPAHQHSEVLTYDLSVGRLILYVMYDEEPTRPVTATYEFDLQSSTWYRQEIDTPALAYSWWDEVRYNGTYDELNQRTVIYNDGRLIVYDAMRHAWTVVSDEPDIYSSVLGVALAYDPNGQRVIAFGANPFGFVRPYPGSTYSASDDVAALDLRSATWTELLAPSAPTY